MLTYRHRFLIRLKMKFRCA